MFEREGQSPWGTDQRLPQFPSLDRSLDVDAAIIGGGLTGVTTACLLKEAGLRVALLERSTCGTGETAHGLGCATPLPAVPVSPLIGQLGGNVVRALWDAGFEAITGVRAQIRERRINCGFSWVRGCLHAGDDSCETHDALTDEAVSANTAGVDASYARLVRGLDEPGIWFEGQIRLDPVRYLHVLLDAINGNGSIVCEHTEVDRIRDGDLLAGPHLVRAPLIVCATGTPPADVLDGAPWLRRALVGSTTYQMAGTAPRGPLPEGIYWERRQSFFTLRAERSTDGCRVMCATVDSTAADARGSVDRFVRLERQLRTRFPLVEITHQWTGRIVETVDKRPCIGEVRPGVFVATGFGSNFLAYGMLAARMAVEHARGRTSRWAELFDPQRLRGSTALPPSGPAPAGDVAGRHPHVSVA
jgi:glycine/D-amino acid oxidase-like deaminating enzyme